MKANLLMMRFTSRMKKNVIAFLLVPALAFLITGCSNSYKITADQFCEGGTIVVDQKEVKANSNFVVTATPDEGYSLKSITVVNTDDQSVYDSSATSPFTVKMGKGDLSITATFVETSKLEDHIISIDQDIEGGKIEIDQDLAVYEDTFTVTAIPDEGYILKSINVLRSSDRALWKSSMTSPFIVEMGEDDLTVTAEFELQSTEMTSEEIAEYLTSRVVVVKTKSDDSTATGSGFFIDDQGTFVTNYHVIEGGSQITVSTADGSNYNVSALKGFSPLYDIAILQIPISGNDYLVSTTEVKQGEDVYAMGSPLCENYSFTRGTISSVERLIGRRECVQTDTATNLGNSGGPLVNSRGEVIAINSIKISSAGIEGMNYSIKMSMLDNIDQKLNYSVDEYYRWYHNEIKDSYYSCYCRYYYYPTYTNTYDVVTGVKCLVSVNDFTNNKDLETGYAAKHIYYQYKYDEDNYEMYCDYLEANGYDYDTTYDCDDHHHVLYTDSYNGLQIELIIDHDELHMYVSCPNDEYWYS